MNYLGDFAEDATVEIPFTTNDGSGGAIAPSTAFEAADVKIYKDGSATQKTATDGLTLTSPFDSITGLHHLTIDTSNDTNDAGFWVAGSEYMVVLDPSDETVDDQTVAAVLATFSIENRSVASVAADIATAQIDLTQIKADLPTQITKNTALANFPFLMVLASDDITPGTGLTVTATRSIDGAAFAACANAVTEIANGWYKISFDASDLNGDTIALRFAASTANDRNIAIVTQP